MDSRILTWPGRKFSIILVALSCLAAGQYYSQKQSARSKTSARVVKAAQDFLGALEPSQRSQVNFSFDSSERKDWSNLPYTFHPRQGVRFGEMSPFARAKAHQLFQSVLSSQGYLKVTGIVHLDEWLRQNSSFRVEDGTSPFGSDYYWVGIFGTPAADSIWGWQLDGHHLALNITVAGDRIALSPSFLGTDPAEVREGIYSGWRILGSEDDLGLAFVQQLDDTQRPQAILADSAMADVFAGPGRADALKEYSGLPASAMSQIQRTLLLQLMDEYFGNLDDDLAEEQKNRLTQAGIDNVHFAWMGPVDPGPRDRYYYRIHGPSVLIEFDNAEAPGDVGGDVNHIHTIWRDPSNDFGEDLLRKHYEENPHHRKD